MAMPNLPSCLPYNRFSLLGWYSSTEVILSDCGAFISVDANIQEKIGKQK